MSVVCALGALACAPPIPAGQAPPPTDVVVGSPSASPSSDTGPRPDTAADLSRRAQTAVERCVKKIALGYAVDRHRVNTAHQEMSDIHQRALCVQRAQTKPDAQIIAAVTQAKLTQAEEWKAAGKPIIEATKTATRACADLSEAATHIGNGQAPDAAPLTRKLEADLASLEKTFEQHQASVDLFVDNQALKRVSEQTRFLEGIDAASLGCR